MAKGLSPGSPEDVAYEAARVADTWRWDLAARGVSFCMETVFSDRQGAKLEFLKECQSSGYTAILVFIGLESAELSLGRVIQRVERGGHDVPDAKIEARFPRTFDNLRQALTFVDEALLFDNSSSDQPFRFVASFKAGKRQRRKGVAPAWHPRRAITRDRHRAAGREQQLMRLVRVRMNDVAVAVGGAERTRHQERLLFRGEPPWSHSRLAVLRHSLSI